MNWYERPQSSTLIPGDIKGRGGEGQARGGTGMSKKSTVRPEEPV